MRPTFNQTVDVLVKAYLNDELAHKICSACAVGNIVAAAIGTKPKRIEGVTVFDNCQYEDGAYTDWYPIINGSTIRPMTQITATGYSIEELKLIEYAFESAPGQPVNTTGECNAIFPGLTTDPTWMFNGLMAVVDVLAEIHGVDLTVKESAKLLFTK